MADNPKGTSVESWSARQGDMTRRFFDFLNDRDPFGLPVARWLGEESGLILPKLDISESDKKMEITVELPGMDEKDVDVEVSDGVLTIKGEKKSEKEEKGKTFHRMERSYGSFQRSFSLPPTVDEEKIKAEFDKGVLTISLEKTATPEPAKKKIEVKSK